MSTNTAPSAENLTNRFSDNIGIPTNGSFLLPSTNPSLLDINGTTFADNPYVGIHHEQQNHHATSATSSSSSSSYTFLQIKREPCQVSEVTTSNNLSHQQQTNSKTMSSTLTTVVKIESSSPKNNLLDKSIAPSQQSNNVVPVGIAVARKRPQEPNQTMTPQLPRECFGIRVGDLSGVTSSSGCGNLFFSGNDLPTSNPDPLAMNAPNIGRTPSTFWQYPNPLQLESVLSMSVPTPSLQYGRDPNRGQFLFLPTGPSLEPLQQTFLWPSYLHQAPNTIQTQQSLLFPPIAAQQHIQPQPFAPFQLYGSNYLATASTTLHQHTQSQGTRFVALTTDTKKNSPIKQQSLMKIEDWNSENATSKSILMAHQSSSMLEKDQIRKNFNDSISNYFTYQRPENLTNSIGINSHNPAMALHCTPSQMNQTMPIQFTPSPPMTSPLISPALVSHPSAEPILRLPINEPIINDPMASSMITRIPEMQDVNIQTDTPVMSEDDNTNDNDEQINSNVCRIAEQPLLMPQLCHKTSPKQITSNDMFECAQTQTEIANNIASNNCLEKHIPLAYVTSTNNLIGCNRNDVNEAYASILSGSKDDSGNYSHNESDQLDQSISKTSSTPVDLTGLELLSNISSEAFENKIVYIKKEPTDDFKNNEDVQSITDSQISQVIDQDNSNDAHNTVVESNCEQLGGLNLLCALAEQRIQEEVDNQVVEQENLEEVKNDETFPYIVSKKKKRKHSKSEKKQKFHKMKKSRKCHRNGDQNGDADHINEEDLDIGDLKGAFKKAKAKFMKHHKCLHGDKQSNCSRDMCNWPNSDEFLKAMEADMRMKLADITRQYRKKKRKLDAFNKNQKKKKQSASDCELNDQLSNSKDDASIAVTLSSDKNSIFPESSLHSSSDSYEALLPQSRCSHSDSDGCGSGKNYECSQDDTPSTSKRKTAIPRKSGTNNTETIVAKSTKNLADYIFSAKTQISVQGIHEELNKTHDKNTDVSMNVKTNATENIEIKQEVFGQYEEENQIECQRRSEKKSKKSSHKSKSKGDKVKHDRTKNILKFNKKLTLTNEHLYQNKTRVLTDMGGLFYAGYLSPLQPPDVYAVTLDGERGNKSHIMSREEVFKDTILELCPSSLDEVPPGTRLCAYWSQQYRCLYPGRAADTDLIDGSNITKFVSVEFDDGDSGRIRLENIRLLLSDYPIVEYDSNPLGSIGKHRKGFSKSNPDLSLFDKTEELHDIANEYHITDMAFKEKKRTKNGVKTNDNQLKPCNEIKLKHKHRNLDESRKRKHKKRKKHKKRHLRKLIMAKTTLEPNNFPDDDPDVSFGKINANEISGNGTNTAGPKINNEKADKSGEVTQDDSTMERTEDSYILNENSNMSEDKKEDFDPIDNHSKIAAFLPARQLWNWLGNAYRKAGQKGKAKKQFYKSIQRGKEIITIGDSAVFLSTGRPDRPYIGRIESMWETTTSNKVVRVKWFYHPEETVGCSQLKFPGGLFESPHDDENDVQTISHKCEVLPFLLYAQKFGPDPKQYQSIYDNNDTYYLAGYYNPRNQSIKLDPTTPIIVDEDVTHPGK